MRSLSSSQTGIGVAIGVFLGNSLLIPLLTDGGWVRGVVTGGISAVLVLLAYAGWGWYRRRRPGRG